MAGRRKKYTVTVVNPRTKPKKKTKKKRARKTAPKKKKSSTMPKRRKRTTRKRRTRTIATRPVRRRRRTVRRKSRANPSRARRAYSYARGRMLVDPVGPWDGMLARVAGKVVSVWAVKRWGDPLTTPNSQTTGQAWTFRNYLIALATGYFGGELTARMVSKKSGNDFYQGSSDFIATKLTWSELVMRWNFSATQLGSAYPSFSGPAYPAFGSAEVQQLMAQGMPGDIIDDGSGNRLLMKGDGRWVAMMGLDGVVEAGPLGDGVVEAGPLGSVVEAGPLGHMMAQSASQQRDALASYTFRGSKDPYRATYM